MAYYLSPLMIRIILNVLPTIPVWRVPVLPGLVLDKVQSDHFKCISSKVDKDEN